MRCGHGLQSSGGEAGDAEGAGNAGGWWLELLAKVGDEMRTENDVS